MFASQIQAQQDTLVKQMGDKLVPEAYLGAFKNLVPTGSLDGILGNATGQFQQVLSLVQGGGGFGNFANQVRNFFWFVDKIMIEFMRIKYMYIFASL